MKPSTDYSTSNTIFKYLSASAAIMACAICPTQAKADTELKLTHTPTNAIDCGQDLSSPATYGATDPIDANTNITVNYSLPYTNMTLTKALSSFTAKNLTFNLDIANNIWSETFFETASNSYITLNSLNINLVESIVSHCINNITIASGSTLYVANDVNFVDSREHKNWFQSRLQFLGSGSVNINGNLTVAGNPQAYTAHAYNSSKLYTAALSSFNVGGVVTISSDIVSTKNIFTLDPDFGATGSVYTRTIGGLNVASNGYLELNGRNSTIHTVQLNFTNSTKAEFNGYLATRINCVRDTNGGNKILSYGEIVDNKINISMNAVDAVNGNQILRFAKAENYDTGNTVGYAFTSGNQAINEVNVIKGRLDMAMYDGMKGDTLSISGGTFSAIGSNSDIGAVNFDYMTFSGGKIYADLSEADGNDIVNIAKQMTKIGDTAAKLTLDIGVSATDLQAWLDAAETDTWSVNLLTFASSGSNVNKEDLQLVLQSGVFGDIELSDIGGVTTVVANLTTVPEPSSIAAIFAAVALAFALRKKIR